MPRLPFKARAVRRFPAVMMLALIVALTLPLLSSKATADLPSPFLSGRAEVWSGGEATRGAWGAWTGLNWSPLGSIEDPGFRIRLSGGSGQYRSVEKTGQRLSVYGTTAFADLLAGYQWSLGPATLKVFAGGTFNGQLKTSDEPSLPKADAVTGAKAMAEAWINMTPLMFAQIDLAFATARQQIYSTHDGAALATAKNAYSTRVRLGYRLTRAFAMGIEAGAVGQQSSNNARLGAFARYEWLGGEISASGGLQGDLPQRRDPYGGLVYLKKF